MGNGFDRYTTGESIINKMGYNPGLTGTSPNQLIQFIH